MCQPGWPKIAVRGKKGASCLEWVGAKIPVSLSNPVTWSPPRKTLRRDDLFLGIAVLPNCLTQVSEPEGDEGAEIRNIFE